MSEETTTTKQGAVSDAALVKMTVGAIGIFLIIAFAKSAMTPTSPDNIEKARDKGAIEQCWNSQGRKDVAPGDARWVASVCYKMEDDFKAKYGN
jgi:hypothetical protein